MRKEKALNWMKIFIKKHPEIVVLLFLTVVTSLILVFFNSNNGGSIVVNRNGYAGEEQQIGLLLQKADATETISLDVRPRQLTQEQCEQKMSEAFEYLEQNIKGENDSLTKVIGNLDFSLDYDTYPFDVEIRPDDYALIDEEGYVKNGKEELAALGYQSEDLAKGISTKVTITLWYGEKSRKKTYSLKIFPKEESSLQKQFSQVKEQILEKEEQALYEEQFVLPAEVNGVQLTRTDLGQVKPFHALLMGFLLAGLLLFREQEKLRNQEKERQEYLRRSYPWFVNKLTLLMGAGMQIKNIFIALIEEYENGTMESSAKEKPDKPKKKDRKKQKDYRDVLIRELKWSRHSLEIGMSEEQVYYQLGRRLKLPCYIKLMTLLEQNVKKGTRGLTAIFEQEELNALEERKNLARRYGEEASTKLLGPMILLLLVVMLMIMIPAFMSFA